MPEDTNALGQLLALAKRAYWHRGDRAPIGHLLDTFEALGMVTRAGLRPVLAHRHKTPTGWHLVWNLPPGIASADVLAKLPHLEEQSECRIACRASGRLLHMELTTAPMPERVDYEWRAVPDMALGVPIGHTVTGLLAVDLPDLPHMLVAGQTGSGKTTYLRGLAVAAVQAGAIVCVVDLKGLDFAHMAKTGHAVVADTESSATALLSALNRELDRRKRLLQAAGATKLQEYPDLPWVVAIVDELAELQDKADQEALNRLARLSRAVGICLVCATQRPSYSLFQRFTDTRMLFSGRLCFHMPDPTDSRLILDTGAAAGLPPSLPGRAIWRHGRETEVQVMDLGAKQAQRLLTPITVREVRDIGDYCGRKRLPAR